MRWQRVQRYAFVQARIRARLGRMPDAEDWHYIAGGRDVAAVVQRMRDHGLDRWVRDLPRSPDMAAVERVLTEGLVDLYRDLVSWLPSQWSGIAQWLQDGLYLIFLRKLLHKHTIALPSQVDQIVIDIAQTPLQQRKQALATTRYARYFANETDSTALGLWMMHFGPLCPPVQGREAYVVSRLRKLIATHLSLIAKQRASWIGAGDTSTLNPDAQWRLRGDVEKEIRELLCGESFHAGAVLAYGLLELLQFERVRAVLIARYFSWEHARVA